MYDCGIIAFMCHHHHPVSRSISCCAQRRLTVGHHLFHSCDAADVDRWFWACEQEGSVVSKASVPSRRCFHFHVSLHVSALSLPACVGWRSSRFSAASCARSSRSRPRISPRACTSRAMRYVRLYAVCWTKSFGRNSSAHGCVLSESRLFPSFGSFLLSFALRRRFRGRLLVQSAGRCLECCVSTAINMAVEFGESRSVLVAFLPDTLRQYISFDGNRFIFFCDLTVPFGGDGLVRSERRLLVAPIRAGTLIDLKSGGYDVPSLLSLPDLPTFFTDI